MGRKSHLYKGRCKNCRKNRFLSQRHLCNPCSHARMVAPQNQIKAREGPYYERWISGMSRFNMELTTRKPSTAKSRKKAKTRRGKHQLARKN